MSSDIASYTTNPHGIQAWMDGQQLLKPSGHAHRSFRTDAAYTQLHHCSGCRRKTARGQVHHPGCSFVKKAKPLTPTLITLFWILTASSEERQERRGQHDHTGMEQPDRSGKTAHHALSKQPAIREGTARPDCRPGGQREQCEQRLLLPRQQTARDRQRSGQRGLRTHGRGGVKELLCVFLQQVFFKGVLKF